MCMGFGVMQLLDSVTKGVLAEVSELREMLPDHLLHSRPGFEGTKLSSPASP